MTKRLLIAALTAILMIGCSGPRVSGPVPTAPMPEQERMQSEPAAEPQDSGLRTLPKPLCQVYVSSGQSPEPLGHEASFAVGEFHAYWLVCPEPVQYPELVWGTRQYGISTNVTMDVAPSRPGTYAMKASFPAEGFTPGDVMVTYVFADGELQGIVRVTVAATAKAEVIVPRT